MSVRSRNCTIRFYRLEPATTDRGGWPENGEVVAKIQRKLANDPMNPYISHHEQQYIVEKHHARPLHTSVSTVRHDNLPLRERRGHTSALDLASDENLAEPTHVIVFGERILAVVRSQNTPGHITTSAVLSKRVAMELAFVPILRPEVEALIVNSIGVTHLDLRVAGTSFSAAAASAGDPVEGVRQLMSRFSGAATATVGVSARTGPDRQRMRSWLVRQLSQGFTNDDGVQAARARVIDRDGQTQMVDLLEDQIAHSVTVETEAITRHLDPEEVRRLAIESFEEQRVVLTRAIELHAAS
jgi:hypothetical protein